ncbi:MAG: polyribonucleotide nucleotidyltransferase [Bacteroidia bacterium]|nr:polyribonucleotide nucleotidyltransferase [Bacteroidia bacterium]
MNNAIVHSFAMPDGTEMQLETGRLAKQADGSVLFTMGNVVLLATIVSDEEAGENVDFLPLTVDYKEKFSSSGKFPGGFIKRETRPSEYEILIMRLVDRALRPLFPGDYHANTVVSIALYSSDQDVYPDTFAALAASAALAVSDIPFAGPISEVRVGKIDGKFVINPKISQMEKSTIDMMIAATKDNIIMVEGEMNEISEEEMVEAINIAHEAIKVQCQAQEDLVAKLSQPVVKREYSHEDSDEELYQKMKDFSYQRVYDITKEANADKKLRSKKFKAVLDEFIETLDEEVVDSKAFLIKMYYGKIQKSAVRNAVLDTQVRLDGRKSNEIRPIWSEISSLPYPHGSAIFTRGETQSLTSITLGSLSDVQMIDGAVIEGKSNFILHYNFPSFSTGEARAPRGTSRREVGHGNLAQRALTYVVPKDIPYTIRIVSDILESNGSSSMATVCAGSLAMMDAGIQTKGAVSGIAMGLIMDEDGRNIILSDILGDEDHLGDMDFKVAGTEKGITATQMDIKVGGLSAELLTTALHQAKEGRLHILNEMKNTIAEPRPEIKPHAPRIEKLLIPKDFIGAVIGPGGKIIQELQATTGTNIAIEEDGDHGLVEVFGNSKDSVADAVNRIKQITQVPEKGEVYEATVKSIMPYGAFVEFMPGKEGLLHISEISWNRIETMDGVFKEGDKVKVKLLDVERNGKFKLSRKVLMPRPDSKANG